jgi:hypothetical protein
MRIAPRLRQRIVRFLALSAAVHVLITAIVLMVEHRQKKTLVVEQEPTKFYPAMLTFAGGAKAEWTPKPPGRKKHPQEVKQTASDLAHALHDAEIVGEIVDGVQRGGERFAGLHQVAQVGARVAAADHAVAGGVGRPWSSAYCLFLMLRRPSLVKSRPWRAARVGSTQSIMSTPMRAYCSISSG